MADSPWIEIAELVNHQLAAGDSAEALRVIAEAEKRIPAEVPEPGLHEVAGKLYWKHRNLAGYALLSQERIARLEASLPACTDEEWRKKIVRAIGGTHYNLSSFCWPGWDEPEITVTEEQARLGAESAARCVEIRTDPSFAGFPFGYTPSMAYWAMGAYRLLERNYLAAHADFDHCIDLDRRASVSDHLSRGYSLLTHVLERPGDADAESAFQALLAELDARTDDEDAPFIKGQLVTARSYFERTA